MMSRTADANAWVRYNTLSYSHMCKCLHLDVTSDGAQSEQDTLVSVYLVKVPDILQNGDDISGSFKTVVVFPGRRQIGSCMNLL
jgi:hypothetical protein